MQIETKSVPGSVMGVREAAKEIGVHYVTLYRWVKDSEIVYVTFGGSIFIPTLEVERLKKERKGGSLKTKE